MLIEFLLYTIYFLIGTIIGSYSNMLIYRYVYGESIWTNQRSFCPTCKNTLKSYHLVPVWSYVFLKGKCGFCKEQIHPRYFFLEIFSGVLFVFIMNNVHLSVDNIIFYFVLLMFLIPIFYIDVMVHLIYDGYLKFLIVLTALFLYINQYWYQFDLNIELPTLKTALIGLFAVYLSMIIINKLGGLMLYGDYRADLFGMGDVKLIAWMFMLLGTFSDLLLFFFLSACIGLILYALHQLVFHHYYVSKVGQFKIKFSLKDAKGKVIKLKLNISDKINHTIYTRFKNEKKVEHTFFVEDVNEDTKTVVLKNGKTNMEIAIDEITMNKLQKDKKEQEVGFDFYVKIELSFNENNELISYAYAGISDYELYLQSMMRSKFFGTEGVPFAPGLIFGFLLYLLFSDTIFPYVRDMLFQVY